jgi:hypothetical protein
MVLTVTSNFRDFLVYNPQSKDWGLLFRQWLINNIRNYSNGLKN